MGESELPFKTLSIEKSVTVKVQDNYSKTTFFLEVDLATMPHKSGYVEEAKKRAEDFIDRWLEEEKNVTVQRAEVPEIPQVDIGELNALDWQTYQKTPAKQGEAAWVKNPAQFTDWKNPPNALLGLVKALEKARDRKLVLGDMEYSFSGTGEVKDHFVSRRPVKREGVK